MIKDTDFIVFADDWGRTPSSTQHLFRVLGKYNRIFWFNTIGLRVPQMRLYDVRRTLEKLASCFKKSDEKAAYAPFVFNPFMLPLFFPPFLRELNKKILLLQIARIKKRYKVNRPILFTTIPTVCDLVGELGERASVYYCVDEYTCWPGVYPKTIKCMERKLLERAHLLFCSCSEILDLKRKEGFRGILLTHGVDVEHFKKRDFESVRFVAENDRGMARIGFIGSLDHRIDFSLVEFLCLNRTDCLFIFGGRAVELPSRLRKLPNFRYIGSVAYNELPEYLSSFDICIMPYKNDETTHYIAPLKFKEVILSGKPVISTVIPNISEYARFVKCANERDDFLRYIDEALLSKEEDVNFSGLFVNETWEDKAELFSLILLETK